VIRTFSAFFRLVSGFSSRSPFTVDRLRLSVLVVILIRPLAEKDLVFS